MTRNIANGIVTFLIFMFANMYFNEYVSIASTQTLIFATLLMFVMNFIFAYLFLISIALIPFGIGCITSIAFFIIAIFLNPIKLLVLDAYLPGFHVNGFWAYVLLSIALGFFQVSSNSNAVTLNKNNDTK